MSLKNSYIRGIFLQFSQTSSNPLVFESEIVGRSATGWCAAFLAGIPCTLCIYIYILIKYIHYEKGDIKQAAAYNG